MMIYPGVFFVVAVFFQFLKVLIFWVVSGVKAQKIAHNGKKIGLSHSASLESDLI